MKNVTEYTYELLNQYSTKAVKVYMLISALVLVVSSILFIVSLIQSQTNLLYASISVISFFSLFFTLLMQRTVRMMAFKLSLAKVTYTFYEDYFHLHFLNRKVKEAPTEADIYYTDVVKMVADHQIVKIYLRGVSSFFIMSQSGFKSTSKVESLAFLKSKVKRFEVKK